MFIVQLLIFILMGCRKDMTSEEKEDIVKLLSDEKTKLEKKRKRKVEQTS